MALLKEGESPFVADDEVSTIVTNYSDIVTNYSDLITNAGWTDPASWSANSISTVSVNGNLINTNDDFFFPSKYNEIPFKTAFPAFDQVQEMCKEYPGLGRAYENFKTAYALVEQDWKGKQDDK